jgi:LysR family transcriptional regulator, hydrogen peroxide-inducible genes activator
VAGDLEISICCQPGAVSDERLHHVTLFREQFVIVLPQDHYLAERNAIRVSDLQVGHYLERINCEFNAFAERIFEEQCISGETVYRSERNDWILAMAAAGLGFAFMPEECAQHPEVVARPANRPRTLARSEFGHRTWPAPLASRWRLRPGGDGGALARTVQIRP